MTEFQPAVSTNKDKTITAVAQRNHRGKLLSKEQCDTVTWKYFYEA